MQSIDSAKVFRQKDSSLLANAAFGARGFCLGLCLTGIMCLFAFLAPSPAAAADSAFSTAVADYNAGKYGQAASEFESLKQSYPTNALTHYYLALCRQALGHFDKAKQEYQWVSQYGDARLKSLAAQGMTRMGSAKSSVPAGSSSTSYGQSQPAGKIVKKIFDFYADW